MDFKLTCIFLGVSIFLLGITWLLSYLVTLPGSILLMLMLVFLLLKLAAMLALFPGSSWFWRRSIESVFCKEMTKQLLFKVKDLRVFVESLVSNSKTDLRLIPLTGQTRRYIKHILANFEELDSQRILSMRQSRLFVLLKELKSSLKDTRLIVNASEEVSLWSWLEASSAAKPSSIVFEDYPEHIHAEQTMKICEKIENLLSPSCEELSCLKKLARWLTDDTLGSLHYMRVDLVRRFKGEQLWVRSFDSTMIDCLWIPSSRTEGPCMLLCNPNAGYYEFALFQNEWIDFYLRLGVNVMMWNYRGYGRCKGMPSTQKIIKDGEAIVDFLKVAKNAKTIGVHGESLGGGIAVHLAKNCGLNFLLADRTFSNINKTAFFNYGKLASFALKMVMKNALDVAGVYLDLDCYKIISCDYQDSMIKDLGSLKTGVACRLLSNHIGFDESFLIKNSDKKTFLYIFGFQDLKATYEALVRLSRLIHLVSKSNNNTINIAVPLFKQDSVVFSQYQLIAKETDAFDDEELANAIFRLSNALDELDAGGKPFTSIPGTNGHYSILTWALVYDVWGPSPKNLGDLAANRIEKSICKLRKAVSELTDIVESTKDSSKPLVAKVLNDVFEIVRFLGRLLEHFEERSQDLSDELGNEHQQKWLYYDRAGKLLPIDCGHSAPFSQESKYHYERHLVNANFLS